MARAKLLDWKSLADDYARYHTHPMNRLCHAIGIPLIVLCVVRWTQFSFSPFPLAALALVLYFLWDVSLALAMSAVIFAMAAVAPFLHSGLVAGFFVVGWIFQLVGHKVYEGKSPAFTKNLIHLLVGPFWILQEYLAAPTRRTK